MKHLLLIGSMLAGMSTMAYAAEPLTVAPESGDLTVALNTAKEAAGSVGDIVINLAAGATYTVSGSLVAPAGITINGNGATIDATGLEAPFILMDETPAVEVVSDYYRVDGVKIDNVTLTNVANSLFYDNNVKYCVVDFTIANSTIALTTTAVENEAVISFKGGGAKDLTFIDNTIYGNNEVAKYFVRYNNSARLDRYGFDKETEFQTMTYLSNTFYGLLKSDGQWGNYSAISGQNYIKYDVQKNIWYNCGNDIIRRMAGGRFGGSAPLEFAYNTYFNNGESIAESEASYDNSGNILTTNPDFADAAAANFTIGGTTEQAKYQTGATKWLVGYDIELTVSGGDITAALEAAKAGVARVGNIVINFTDAAVVNTLSGSLVAPAGLTINGNGATIDAAGLNAPVILMDANPSAPLINDYYRVNAIKLDNVNIINVANSLFYDNNVKYCVVDFTIANSTIALTTTAVENEAVISFKGGGAKDLTFIDNTIYGNNEVAKYFVRYNNSARLDRYGFDKNTDFQVMTYKSNTFYGLLKSDGQWGNYSAISGQNYIKYDVQKNIWYNCGNDIIRRMAGGRFGGSAPLEFAYNTYFNNGESIAESEASYDNSGNILTTNPDFADAAAANFTIGATTEQAKYQTGATKWLVPYQDEEFTQALTDLYTLIYEARELLGDDIESEAGSKFLQAIEYAKYVAQTADTIEALNNAYYMLIDAINEYKTTGIEAISNENAPVEYYNLQGVRVADPSNGIFIRKQGTTTTKVIIK